MRPVTRGPAPPGATRYEEMRRTLLERLGCYCSYCEYPVGHVPHAEHVIPRGRFPEERDEWENLLVSCTYCNSHKGKKRPEPARVDDYLWPARDNTARAFTYANIVPELADDLTGPVRNKAAMLRGLVQLGLPGDERANERAAVFVLAQRYASQMGSAPDVAWFRQTIVDLALARGFFSVWMEVFAADVPMRRALIDAFAGTAQDCFDPATCVPVPRPGGRL
jgi:hypothetical protein